MFKESRTSLILWEIQQIGWRRRPELYFLVRFGLSFFAVMQKLLKKFNSEHYTDHVILMEKHGGGSIVL